MSGCANQNVELRETRQYGKALFASRRFAAGQVVLTEQPIFRVVDVERILRGSTVEPTSSVELGRKEGNDTQLGSGEPGSNAEDAEMSAHPAVKSPAEMDFGEEGLVEILRTMVEISDRSDVQKGTVNLLYTFLWQCDDETRKIILSLYCPHQKVKAPTLLACEAACEEIVNLEYFQRWPSIYRQPQTLLDFLVIFDINCHGDELYNLSTRLAHSCAPNTFCRSEAGGALSYTGVYITI